MNRLKHSPAGEQAKRIQALNDAFRTTFQGGRVLITRGVQSLPDRTCAEILQKVRSFSGFTRANDPHGEHDFGSFEHAGQSIFWKIDYYDQNLEFGSEHPSDPSRTTRVLTI